MQKKMMKNNGYLVVGMLLVFVLLPVVSSAGDDEFMKIFSSPFYTPQIVENTNHTFNFSIETGEFIDSVHSALFTLQVYTTAPNQYFYLTVDGQSCNNPYYIASSVGIANTMFDCSNIFTDNGEYEVSVFSNKNSTSAIAWLDFSYDSSEVTVKVHGTEYVPYDIAKEFLQLLDGDSLPITDADCFVSIYYPNNTLWKYQQPMAHVNEGVYVYDVVVPNIFGVYPVTSYCVMGFPTASSISVFDDFNSGVVSGGVGWSNDWGLDGCYFESVNVQEGAYSIECANDQAPSRSFSSNSSYASLDYSFYYRGDSLEASDFIYFNIVDASGTSHTIFTLTDGLDDGSFHQTTGTLYANVDSFDFDGTLSFELDTSGSLGNGDYYNFDLVNLTLNAPDSANVTEYQSIRGSGEIHCNQPFNMSEFADVVWTYDNKSLDVYGDALNYSLLEEYIIDAIGEVNVSVDYDLIEDLIVQYANDDTTNYTLMQELIEDYANQDTTNYTLMEYLIVQYSNQESVNYTLIEDLITQYANDDNTNYTLIEYIVNSYTVDNTNYALIQSLISAYGNNDSTNYTMMEYLITNYANEDTVNYSEIEDLISSYVSDETNYTLIEDLIMAYAIDETNYTLIEELMITYATDETNYTLIEDLITAYAIDETNYTLIEDLIIAYANDETNYTLIQDLIEDYGNEDNTNYSLMEYIVFNYGNDDNTNYSLMEYIVSNYGNDDNTNYTLMQFLIEEYGNNDVTNYTLIQDLISQYGNDDTINYTLIQEITQTYGNDDVANYTLIENLLSQYAETDPTNYTLIQDLIEQYSNNLTAEDIWNYDGTLSSNILDSISNSIWSLFNSTYDFTTMIADAVWIFDNRTLSDSEYDKIAEYVWTHEGRNLTFYQVNDITVEDIWSYMNRSLTFYPEQEEINYSEVAEFVWMYADRNLTTEYINNMTVEEIWSYYNRSLTQDIPLEIWSYENRNLTTDIPFEIWNYYNRTLTYYTLNLTDLVDQINNYEFEEDVILNGIDGYTYSSDQLNVLLYVEK